MSESELVAHPLFPLPEDEEDSEAPPPDVQEIIVQRKENGRMVTAPRTFLPNELTSLLELHAEYGGGEYILVGRDHKKVIRGRRSYILPGTSKPLFDDGVPVGGAKPAQTPANPMSALMGGSGQGEGGIMALIMMMMQQMMQQASAAQAQQTQMFMAMMNNSANTSAADKAAQQEAYNRQRDQDRQHSESMMAMVKELAGARTSGGSDESFFKGVEFMRAFAKGEVEAIKAASKGGDSDLESLLGSLGEAISGGLQLYQMSKEGVPPGQIPGAPAVQ